MTDVEARLRELVIETPSWGYGDSGTRFGTFPQPGRPRDVFERIDDAAEVHRLTGTAGAVALHFPWDEVDDYGALREHIEARGLRSARSTRTCSRTPTTSSARSPTRTRACARRRSRTCVECLGIAAALGSTAQSLWLADGTNYPGQDDLRARRAPAATTSLCAGLRAAARPTRSCWSSTSSSSRRSTPPTSPTGAPRC